MGESENALAPTRARIEPPKRTKVVLESSLGSSPNKMLIVHMGPLFGMHIPYNKDTFKILRADGNQVPRITLIE